MTNFNLPNYLLVKLAKANLLTLPLNSLDDVVQVYAQLKLSYPSLNKRGLYDLYAWFKYGEYPNHEIQRLLCEKYSKLPPHYPKRKESEILRFMTEAYNLAEIAAVNNEVPVGAIVVYQDQIIGRGYNQTRFYNSSLYHAEIIAIKQAQQFLDSSYLSDCDLFVTLEPCLMCSGTLINTRIKRLYYGANELKTGACVSQYSVFDNLAVNHHTEVIGGVLAIECLQLLQNFFNGIRN